MAPRRHAREGPLGTTMRGKGEPARGRRGLRRILSQFSFTSGPYHTKHILGRGPSPLPSSGCPPRRTSPADDDETRWKQGPSTGKRRPRVATRAAGFSVERERERLVKKRTGGGTGRQLWPNGGHCWPWQRRQATSHGMEVGAVHLRCSSRVESRRVESTARQRGKALPGREPKRGPGA